MALIRQLPGMYLRGSVANITMANLTPQQQEELREKFELLKNHEVLTGHRKRVIRELQQTIRGDYAEDAKTAEQEFQIAIWRGLVSILFHKDYSFQCQACGESTYLTQRGRPKAIDRIQTPCPNCKHAQVKNPGDSDLEAGSFILHSDYLDQFKDFAGQPPELCSSIQYIPGDKKYEHPEKILDCPEQIRKFFGEFIWNYFRQQIKENRRVAHSETQTICVSAPEMVKEMILSACEKYKITVEMRDEPHGCVFYCSVMQSPPEFSVELADIIVEARTANQLVSVDNSGIICGEAGVQIFEQIMRFCSSHRIKTTTKIRPGGRYIYPSRMNEALQEYLNQIAETAALCGQQLIIHDDYVQLIENRHTDSVLVSVQKSRRLQTASSSTDEKQELDIEQIANRTLRGTTMDFENHTEMTDLVDARMITRSKLPDENCKRVYDILSQDGLVYEEYASKYGDSPKTANIAQFLGITSRSVKGYKEAIKIYCLANDFVPQLVRT